jgi:hypothetical protein
MWYDDPAMVIAVIVTGIGLGYLTYKIIKTIWDML